MAQLFLEYLRVLAWPLIALTALFGYRKIIASLIPGSKVKLTLSGFTIETTLPVIEQSVTDSLGGKKLTPSQLSLLKRLRDEGRIAFNQSDVLIARPLRNAGLIKHFPEDGFLQGDAKEIEITSLGKLLVEASGKG